MPEQHLSPQEQARVKLVFAERRRRQLLAIIPALGGFLAIGSVGRAAGPVLGLPPSVWQGVGVALILGIVVFSLVNWRCPACSGYLGRGLWPAYCRRCGVALRD